MPKVATIPVGQDVSAIAGLSERARSVEAKRNEVNLSTGSNPVTISVPPSMTWTQPEGWPSIQACVGTSGGVWCMFGALDAGFAFNLGVGIDGAVPTSIATQTSTALALAYGCMCGIPGISTGWHTFSLWVEAVSGVTYTATGSSPWLIAWAI